jgi:hypothetical protein
VIAQLKAASVDEIEQVVDLEASSKRSQLNIPDDDGTIFLRNEPSRGTERWKGGINNHQLYLDAFNLLPNRVSPLYTTNLFPNFPSKGDQILNDTLESLLLLPGLLTPPLPKFQHLLRPFSQGLQLPDMRCKLLIAHTFELYLRGLREAHGDRCIKLRLQGGFFARRATGPAFGAAGCCAGGRIDGGGGVVSSF